MNKIYNAHEEKVNEFAESMVSTNVSIRDIAGVLKEKFTAEELNILIKKLTE